VPSSGSLRQPPCPVKIRLIPPSAGAQARGAAGLTRQRAIDPRIHLNRMVRRVPMLALLVARLAILVVLTPLAYATPPGPTWVSLSTC